MIFIIVLLISIVTCGFWVLSRYYIYESLANLHNKYSWTAWIPILPVGEISLASNLQEICGQGCSGLLIIVTFIAELTFAVLWIFVKPFLGIAYIIGVARTAMIMVNVARYAYDCGEDVGLLLALKFVVPIFGNILMYRKVAEIIGEYED